MHSSFAFISAMVHFCISRRRTSMCLLVTVYRFPSPLFLIKVQFCIIGIIFPTPAPFPASGDDSYTNLHAPGSEDCWAEQWFQWLRNYSRKCLSCGDSYSKLRVREHIKVPTIRVLSSVRNADYNNRLYRYAAGAGTLFRFGKRQKVKYECL